MKAAALALLVGAAQAQTGAHYIHGSWVNVREAADAGARVVDQLVTNTPVTVLARQGPWCQLGYGAGKGGYVACNLLGPQALTLAQASGAPARAFWISPSPNRLAAYGQSLAPPASLRLEALKKTTQAGDVVRYPAVAEFEAAKKRMKAGVTLSAAQEITRPAAVDMAAVMRAYGIKPVAIRPSLFRTQGVVALVSEADADGLAAVAGSKVGLTPTTPPVAWHSRHEGPEIEGVTGFWDVGLAVLDFEPPLVLYSVAANGLVGAKAVRKLPLEVGGPGHYCGARFLGKSLPNADDAVGAGNATEGLEAVPLRGYPTLKAGSEWIVSLVVPRDKPLSPSARVRTQSEPVQRLKSGDGPLDAAKLKELKPRVVLREIDLDGDGVADVMQLEVPVEAGMVSVDVVYHRDWYLNIGGQWFPAGAWEDQDCT